MMANIPSRADDERVLQALQARCAEKSLGEVADLLGYANCGSASRAIVRVRSADRDECGFWGDNQREVNAYWAKVLPDRRRDKEKRVKALRRE